MHDLFLYRRSSDLSASGSATGRTHGWNIGPKGPDLQGTTSRLPRGHLSDRRIARYPGRQSDRALGPRRGLPVAHHHRDLDEVTPLFVVGELGPRSEEHTSELQSLIRISYAV